MHAFLEAKRDPIGAPSTPIIRNGQVQPLPTGKVKSTMRITTAPTTAAAYDPVGSSRYLLFAYCPSLTWSHGTGGIPETTKLSGLSVLQTDNITSPIT